MGETAIIMIRHYEGKLGIFDYDDTEWAICREYLQYIGDKTEGITIPTGITNYNFMFHGCTSLTSAPTIPNGVTNCRFMFCGCKSLTSAPTIPEGVIFSGGIFKGCTSLIS